MSAARPVPAILQAATESETDYGGREEAWTDVATLWVSLSLASPGQALDGAQSAPVDSDTATATARNHPDAEAGQRLLIADDPAAWRLRRVDRGVPTLGRMTLRLDRLT